MKFLSFLSVLIVAFGTAMFTAHAKEKQISIPENEFVYFKEGDNNSYVIINNSGDKLVIVCNKKENGIFIVTVIQRTMFQFPRENGGKHSGISILDRNGINVDNFTNPSKYDPSKLKNAWDILRSGNPFLLHIVNYKYSSSGTDYIAQFRPTLKSGQRVIPKDYRDAGCSTPYDDYVDFD